MADWIEEHCVIPDADRMGEPYVLTTEMLRFLERFYEVNDDGRFVHRRGQLVRPQKWGKGPFSAAIICASHVRVRRTTVPAEFAERIELASHQKAADYTVDRTRIGMINTAIEAAVLIAFTLGGGLAWLHGFWSTQLDGLSYGVAMILSITLLSGLIDLPLSLYRQFVIEARYGFNRMSLGLFFADLLKQTLLGLAIGIPVILAVLWLMGAMGTHWWLWVWLFWSAFNLVALFVYPTWIAPLFNKFSPLEEGEMKTRIEALLARCGFRSSGLFVMDGSKRSSHGNAYFTGFGNNKRIVFFDTVEGLISEGSMRMR